MIVKILDRLYIGDCKYTDEHLEQNKISYVINVGGKKTHLEDKHIHLRDDGGNSYPIIQGLVCFIRKIIYFDQRVLIHCRAGISRSPYIAVKFLSCVGFSLFDAIEFVQERHPMTQINQELLRTVGEGK